MGTDPNAPRQILLGLWVSALAVLALAANRPPDAPPEAPPRTRSAEQKRAEPSPQPPSGLQALLAGRPLDLNRASAADLELLPGIGPRLADRIVADRSAHGPFEQVQALVRVPGVGQGKLRAVEALLFVGPTAQ